MMVVSHKFIYLLLVCILAVVPFLHILEAKASDATLRSDNNDKAQKPKIDYDEETMLSDDGEHTNPVTVECSPRVNCAFKTYNRFGDISGTIVYCGRCSEGYECRLTDNNINSCYLTYTCLPEEQENTESPDANVTEVFTEVIIPERYVNIWPRILNLTAEAETATFSPRRGREQDLSNCDSRRNTNTKRDGDFLDVHEL